MERYISKQFMHVNILCRFLIENLDMKCVNDRNHTCINIKRKLFSPFKPCNILLNTNEKHNANNHY